MRPVASSTVSVLGMTMPPTIASPKPHVAVITACSRWPGTGLAVKSLSSLNLLIHDLRFAICNLLFATGRCILFLCRQSQLGNVTQRGFVYE